MEPIAIIGYSFKLPHDAVDEQSLWKILQDGENVMTEWPESRIRLQGFLQSDAARHNRLTARGAHFLKQDPFAFDASFFSIPSKEAAVLDPQQRWLLETSFHALENAGLTLENVAGSKTAVYTASMADDYCRILSKDPDEAPQTTITGVSPAILANKLSWYFDLRGPSVHVDTACSSSMIAMDLACQSLRLGQSSMAMVAGCNIILSPEPSVLLSNMNFLSPSSVCYSFDHRANGYGRGEGAIVLVLKRLSDAVRDGNIVRGVIRGIGTNQDGHTPGITQPSTTSQEALIRGVYENANLGFESTRYIEGHGTGTPLGDPLEMNALGRVFRASRSPEEPLYVGSVKANVGHLEGASALAGIVKSIMILEKGLIPPNALFEKLNPQINAKFYNIKVPTSCIKWPTDGLRRISINSMGFGGSNGHLILDDAYHSLMNLSLMGIHRTVWPTKSGKEQPLDADENGLTIVSDTLGNSKGDSKSRENAGGCEVTHTNGKNTSNTADLNGIVQNTGSSEISHAVVESNGFPTERVKHHEAQTSAESPDSPRELTNGTCEADELIRVSAPRLLVWSAKDSSAIKRMLAQCNDYIMAGLAGDPGTFLSNLAYTLASKRSAMAWRSFSVMKAEDIACTTSKPTKSSGRPGIAYLFTGQGAHYVNMGIELLHFPVFRLTLQEAARAFKELGGDWDLLEELRNRDRVNDPAFSQPLCTALQIALVELMKSFNIHPVAVVGHSSGEIAAAYTIGALSLASACKVAYHRGKLAAQLAALSPAPSDMLAVNLSTKQAETYMKKSANLGSGALHIACINSPNNVTLSGLEADIDAMKQKLDEDGIFSQKLNTGVAYHSPALASLSDEYLAAMGRLEQGTSHGSILMVSTVTGERVSTRRVQQAKYWVENLVSPVLFSDAVQYLLTVAPKVDLRQSITDLLEMGPHGALRRPTKEISGGIASIDIRYCSILMRSEPNLTTVLETAGRLWTYGYPVSVSEVNQLHPTRDAPRFLVDSPVYPFDHSQKHVFESRLSRNFRFREAPPRDILGTRVVDWNPLEPRWRKFLSIDEIPWIGEHIVGDTPLYPGTATIMMALEAMAQTAQPGRTISGFLMKEAEFKRPVVVRPGPDGRVETMLYLSPLQEPYEKSSSRSIVRLFAHSMGDWLECFKATFQTEYEEAPTQVDTGFETKAAMEARRQDYDISRKSCDKHVSEQTFYKTRATHGLHYGDTFRLLRGIQWDGKATALAHIDTDSLNMPTEGIVHPAVLDAICQLSLLPPSSHRHGKDQPTMVPHRMFDAWISPLGFRYPETSRIRIMTRAHLKPASSGFESSVTAISDNGSTLFSVQRVDWSPIASDSVSTTEGSTNLLWNIDWKPQLSLLSPDQLSHHLGAGRGTTDDTSMIEYCHELERTIYSVIQDTTRKLPLMDLSGSPAHIKKYLAWFKRQDKELTSLPDNIDIDSQIELVMALKPSWRLFGAIAKQIIPIIRGDVDPLELLFSDSLAEDFYADVFQSICDDRFVSLLALTSHQTPTQKVLEVGAGTGGMTSHVLSAFEQTERRSGGVAFSEYVYTDISGAFFDKARERFSAYENRMTFRVLDLEEDIVKQGFETASYDLILAGSVLHATTDLTATFRNLRRVLKPGGKLIFIEPAAPESVLTNFAFGVLPGWWSGKEKNREWCPALTDSEWGSVLQEAQFSGSDMLLRDRSDDAAHLFTVVVSTAIATPTKLSPGSRVVFVVADGDANQMQMASAVINVFDDQCSHMTLPFSKLEGFMFTSSDYVVFLVEIGKPFLHDISEPSFELLKAVIQTWTKAIWVTSSYLGDPSYPHYGLATGLIRTLRSEGAHRHFLLLALEDPNLSVQDSAKHIVSVVKSSFDDDCHEQEYVIRDGQIHTPRIVEQNAISSELRASLIPQTVAEPWLPGVPLKLEVGTRGSLETLHFIEDTIHCTTLGSNEVEIEASAWGVGFRDVFIALGRLDAEFASDCAGIVRRVGCDCKMLQPGDRVAMVAAGCLRTYPRAEERTCIKIPENISFEEAAAVINPGTTAYYSLIDVARLRKGERILIHSATGATGQMAIRIAQMVGAEVFATVGFDNKKKLLVEEFNIPDSHIFYSRNLSFAKGIMRMTGGYGVDVVLNSLSGEGLRASWECVAPYGRFVELGKADIEAHACLPMASFSRNATFSAVDLYHIVLYRPELWTRLLSVTMELVSSGIIRGPEPLNLYRTSEIEGAFRHLQSGKNSGRIVIKMNPDDVVQKRVIRRHAWTFDSDGAYVVVGGFGGIGRAILGWMATKGVKHLIVPSRSGPASPAACEVVKVLRDQGINVATPRCDTSSLDSFAAVLDECAKIMPPVRGCINAAMVLQDSIFERMTHGQWELTVRSKAGTSFVLHSLLPRNLDFFVLLSSLAGIVGTVGQANYAAGCTFQDAIARYRASNNEKSISVDIGWMRSVGVIAENVAYQKHRENQADIGRIETEEFLTLLEIYCDPRRPLQAPQESQILIGVVTPADLLSAGQEVPAILQRPIFGYHSLERRELRAGSLRDTKKSPAVLFKQAQSTKDRSSVVLDALAGKLSRALSISSEDIDSDQRLSSYGVDSLVAVELRNWIAKDFAADIAVYDIMGGLTVAALASLVSQRSKIAIGNGKS